MHLLNSLLWRSALKSFHPIAPSLVNIQPILECIRWAPSSNGVSPYDIHVVTDDSLKKALREASFDQPQVTECSHLLIFCAHNDAENTVERFIQTCSLDADAPAYAASLRRSLSDMDKEAFQTFSTNQAFVALGVGVCAAAEARIGSCPMSGFIPKDVHKVMQLPDTVWPVCYLAIGSHLDGVGGGDGAAGSSQDIARARTGTSASSSSISSSGIIGNTDPKRLKVRVPLDKMVFFH